MTPIKLERSEEGARSSDADSLVSEITTIRELIDRMAEAHGEATFLVSPDTGQVLSFVGLQEQAEALSAQLQQSGLEQGDKVAFLMDNSLFAAQLFLGVMYGGLVSVPLNVRAGVSQLSYMVEHCDAKMLFVGDEYEALAEEVMVQVRRPVRLVRSDVEGAEALSDSRVPRTQSAIPSVEDVALLIYTSGSTGHPKAAVHTHRTILAGGRNSVASHRLTAADRSLLVLPLYHINAECVTLVPTLLSGGSVVVPHRFSISQFWDWLDDYQCTWSAIVPTIVSQLLDWNDPKANQRGPAFERIRFLRSSSAPLAPSLHREFLAKFPLLLIQAMGSSEGGNIFSNPLPPLENKIGSPGLPWGFEVKIVDRDGEEVPAGEPGEMLIRGEAMSCAYFKEPKATGSAFDREGWLHTGDLAYRDSDGYFFVVGRSKELIIKGGVNIAPRQIDDVLESHPAVLEAAAVGVPDRHLGEDVVAFVVLRSGVECDERELLGFCEGRLGHFKTPTRIHFAEDLPKGPSGKVQRLRLLEQMARPDASGLAPMGFALARAGDQKVDEVVSALPVSIEGVIAAIWSEVLKVREVGVDENFFALGGDSLMAIQSISRLRDKIAVRLTLTDFFENGTVAEQATLIRERHAAASRLSDESPLITSGRIPGVLPAANKQEIPTRDPSLPYQLSPLQERLWFMERLNPGQPIYNEAEAVRVQGELNVEALERALNAVIARHEVLRTTIEAVDGVAMARVRESHVLRLKMIDLANGDAAERVAELERLLISEPRVPYHLEEEPAIRATLIRLGEQEHVFILMMHHLICDWSSEGVLWRELSMLYGSYCRNESIELPALALQHGDYAVWQREQLTEAAVADDLAFWTENLRGAPPLLEVPSERPRPQVLSYRGARHRFRISRALTEAFRELSRREKKSLFALFTAAFDVLLYRYTGQEDILLGIPIAERDRPGFQSMIGFLLHTHILRTVVKGELTFRELFGKVQQGALQLYEHRSVPFDRVVRAMQPERSLSYSPLFQVMVNWRDRDQHLCFIGLEGLDIESVLVDSKISKFDLTLFLTDMGEEVWAEMEYSTDLFDAASIERMFGNYVTLLSSAVSDPDQLIGKLDILTDVDRHELIVERNKTDVQLPTPNKCIHELFTQQVERTPEALAAECGASQWSYRELNERANQLACYLRLSGVGSNTLVAVCMARSLDLLVALLGILKAGGAYVPMDPAYPKERLRYILEDSKAPIVLTEYPLIDLLPNFAGRLVCLDKEWSTIDREPKGNLVVEVKPEHLSYVLFTSGSTGRPKGVALEHRSASNFVQWATQVFTPQELASVLFSTSICFDLSVFEIFTTLSAGGKIVMVPDVLHLINLPQRLGVTLINTVPSAMAELVRADAVPVSVKTVNLAGEPLPDALVEEIYASTHADKVYNLYGPTESTTYSTYALMLRGCRVTIGRPIANTQCYILDANLNPVPIGVNGELYLSGAGLARGYYGRSDITNERFVTNPYSVEQGGRMYRTGDLCRWLPDGAIQYSGRVDHQIKLRGFRVELGEIENALLSHSGVREAVVVQEEREKQLIAYVVLTGEPPCTTAELRDYLKQKLPAYMVPAAFSVLESIPLTPNGKVDRKALSGKGYAAEGPSGYSLAYDWTLPRKTLLEAQLLQIWQEVLGARYMGLRDSFFDLGGHSLLALKMIDQVNRLFDVSLSVPAFFLNPTIESIARTLEQENNVKPVPKIVPLQQGQTEGTVFFFDASIGLCRLAELLCEGPASFALSSMLPQSILEVARGYRIAKSIRLEDMAAPLVELIKAERRSEPCVLAGYCWSGNLAFEVARQLQRDGVRVDLIVLVDSWQKAPHFWQRLSVMSRARVLPAVEWRLRHLWETARRFASRARKSPQASDIRGPAVGGQDVPTGVQVKIFHTVRNQYQCRPLETRGLLIRARDDRFSQISDADGTHGWGRFFKGGLEVVDVPGDHFSMLADYNISNISDVIEACLTQLANLASGQTRVA
jgi:amino acid adenylation domain-containing protein